MIWLELSLLPDDLCLQNSFTEVMLIYPYVFFIVPLRNANATYKKPNSWTAEYAQKLG